MEPVTIILFLIGLGVGVAGGVYALNSHQTRRGQSRLILAEQDAEAVIKAAGETAANVVREGEEQVKHYLQVILVQMIMLRSWLLLTMV